MTSISSNPADKATVVGGGLAGCMLALLLGQKGLPLRVVEYREEALGWQEPAQPGHKIEVVQDKESDRKYERAAFGQLTDVKARSINLALSHRGIEALKKVGLFDRVKSALIPMEGRAIHSRNGKVSLQPYGIDHQAIYSVSRTDLNNMLVEELQKLPNVELNFASKVSRVLRDGTVQCTNKEGHRVDFPSKFVIGADGAFSVVRQSMQRLARVDFSQMYLSHGYKELTIPPNAQGDFALPLPNALHIWPHHDFMLIALPNPDKTFTATLFAPWEGPEGLNALVTEEKVTAYLHKYFPDAVAVMPKIVAEFLTNPSSPLLSIRCDPWVFEDKIALIGDAAHAAVPFYGQGMNCAFEDGLVFSEIWDQLGGDVSKVIPEFNRVRQPIGSAIVELSLANFEEMGSKTVRPLWVAKRKIELLLHRMFPQTWIPQYNMVSFTRIPYHIAQQRAERQDKLLGWGMAVTGTAAIVGVAKLAYDAWRGPQGSQ